MEDAGKPNIGDKFTNILKAGKNLPGKILLSLKDEGAVAGGSPGPGDSSMRSPFAKLHSRTPSTVLESGYTGADLAGSSPSARTLGMVHQDGSNHGAQEQRGGGHGGLGPGGSSGSSNALVSTLKEATSTMKDTMKEALSGLRIGNKNKAEEEAEVSAGPSTSGRQAAPSNGPAYVPKHRMDKFNKLLDATVVDIDALRELAWNGIPHDLRPVCWRLLLGYQPPAKARQANTLARKRAEYQEMVPQYYDVPTSELSEDEQAALRQVIVDVPRTAPNVPFFHEKPIQKSLERLLYIWGIRHPASGYVQGMNDLVTPFLAIFLSAHLPGPMDTWKAEDLTEPMLLDVEADCYWCLCKLVEGIQDHYTYAQPGIQRAVFKIQELVGHMDKRLADKLAAENLDFIQFAWRWVNCLLIRELPFPLSFRLWDTYLAEGSRMCEFLVYVCGSFLVHWSKELMAMDFQEMILFLQRLPTSDWDEPVLEVVLSRAFMWLSNWSSHHLSDKNAPSATRELDRFKAT